MSEARLQRIEEKLDRLSDAMVNLVRVEERIGAIFSRLDGMDKRFMSHGDRITEIERASDKRGAKLGMVERAAWLVFASVIALAFYYIKEGTG